MTKTTIEILCAAARNVPRSQLSAEAREIAERRGADPRACERFAEIEAKLDAGDRLPTAEELVEIGALAREIDAQ